MFKKKWMSQKRQSFACDLFCRAGKQRTDRTRRCAYAIVKGLHVLIYFWYLARFFWNTKSGTVFHHLSPMDPSGVIKHTEHGVIKIYGIFCRFRRALGTHWKWNKCLTWPDCYSHAFRNTKDVIFVNLRIFFPHKFYLIRD